MKAGPSDLSTSPYYPRRARWHSRLWYGWNHLRHARFLKWMPPVGNVPAPDLVLSCVVPGYVLRLYHFPRLSRAVMVVYATALVLFLLAYGHLAANLAFGWMLAAHAASVGLILQRWLQLEGLRARLLCAVLSMLIASAFIYLPARRAMLARFLPLETGQGIVIIRRESLPRLVQRGESVVFAMTSDRVSDRVYRHEGFAIERVLGVAGDRVEFRGDHFLVNDIPHPALQYMPAQGELVVPEKHFFVWPQFDITVRNVSPAEVSAGMLAAAVFAQKDIVGRPCRRWFGLRQPVP